MTVIVILLICFAHRSKCHTDICVPDAFSFTIILMAVMLVGGRHSYDSFFAGMSRLCYAN